MKQLIGYAGVALLVLLGMRINRPEVHPEPQPPPPPAVVVAQAPPPPEAAPAPAAPQGG